MTKCERCGGAACEDEIDNFSIAEREFSCVNCGERWWVQATSKTDVRGSGGAVNIRKKAIGRLADKYLSMLLTEKKGDIFFVGKRRK